MIGTTLGIKISMTSPSSLTHGRKIRENLSKKHEVVLAVEAQCETIEAAYVKDSAKDRDSDLPHLPGWPVPVYHWMDWS